MTNQLLQSIDASRTHAEGVLIENAQQAEQINDLIESLADAEILASESPRGFFSQNDGFPNNIEWNNDQILRSVVGRLDQLYNLVHGKIQTKESNEADPPQFTDADYQVLKHSIETIIPFNSRCFVCLDVETWLSRALKLHPSDPKFQHAEEVMLRILDEASRLRPAARFARYFWCGRNGDPSVGPSAVRLNTGSHWISAPCHLFIEADLEDELDLKHRQVQSAMAIAAGRPVLSFISPWFNGEQPKRLLPPDVFLRLVGMIIAQGARPILWKADKLNLDKGNITNPTSYPDDVYLRMIGDWYSSALSATLNGGEIPEYPFDPEPSPPQVSVPWTTNLPVFANPHRKDGDGSTHLFLRDHRLTQGLIVEGDWTYIDGYHSGITDVQISNGTTDAPKLTSGLHRFEGERVLLSNMNFLGEYAAFIQTLTDGTIEDTIFGEKWSKESCVRAYNLKRVIFRRGKNIKLLSTPQGLKHTFRGYSCGNVWWTEWQFIGGRLVFGDEPNTSCHGLWFTTCNIEHRGTLLGEIALNFDDASGIHLIDVAITSPNTQHAIAIPNREWIHELRDCTFNGEPLTEAHIKVTGE